MRFLSVCSGIEAASVAWGPLGWKAVAFSEIEPFPCAVLKHHYPDTPNWGDMTKYKDWPDVSIDLLCGGTPCQSFSVAGLRKGLDDPRGNLMLTFGAIAAKYRPQWLVWENVPGVLSSNGGGDFGAFLGMLGQLGYGFAYRVLDAQYFGVAQRRRRVFVVGCLGDWRSAAAVLFERHSMQGNPAPSRQTGQVITPTIRAGAANGGAGHGARSGDSKDELIVPVTGTQSARTSGGGGLGTDFELGGGLIAGTLEASIGRSRGAGISAGTLCVSTGQAGAEIGADMAPTLNCNHEAPYAVYTPAVAATLVARSSRGGGQTNSPGHQADSELGVTHSLRGEGFDASEDGTGRGTPLVPVLAPTMDGRAGRSGANSFATSGGLVPVSVALRGRDGGATAELGDELAFSLRASSGGGDKPHVLAFDTTQVTSVANRSNPKAGDPCHPLAAGMHAPAIAFPANLSGTQCASAEDVAPSMGAANPTAIAFDSRMRGAEPAVGREERPPQTMVERTGAIDATKPWNVATAMQVRRLTPMECERLQGFPDGYTDVPNRGKPAADGPRYKALGNSWAVPNVRWIGKRIDAVALINKAHPAMNTVAEMETV